VNNLPTEYGTITFTMTMRGRKVVAELSGNLHVPSGKIFVRSPLDRPAVAATLDGRKSGLNKGDGVLVRRLPARVEFSY
jgi:hypothetical protein